MIHIEWRQRVVLVTIDRPERRNAVDLDTLVALRASIDEAAEREARAVVLAGASGVFSAGADLTGVESDGFASALSAVLGGFTALPCATVAAVDGAALGAGCQLAAACDLRVATTGSRFGIPAARLGLVVDAWTVDRLAALLGGATARAVLLAGEIIDGKRAYELGFVQRIGGVDAALAWAEEIAALAPLTITGHKVALEHPADADVIQAARTRAWSSGDAVEGRRAFLEKRPPNFTGR
jgi:enoyl-CoA hydratase